MRKSGSWIIYCYLQHTCLPYFWSKTLGGRAAVEDYSAVGNSKSLVGTSLCASYDLPPSPWLEKSWLICQKRNNPHVPIHSGGPGLEARGMHEWNAILWKTKLKTDDPNKGIKVQIFYQDHKNLLKSSS